MDEFRRIERRREPRTPADLPLLVWGVDIKGECFKQEAQARDISLSGALLSGIDADLRSGDVIGVLCGQKRRRSASFGLAMTEPATEMQVAIHRMEAEECPWAELLNDKPDTISH